MPNILESILLHTQNDDLYAMGNAGFSGTWCNVMYLAVGRKKDIKSRKITPSKLFPAYLISKDCSKIYLVLMFSEVGKSERKLINLVNRARSTLNVGAFDTNTENMQLGDNRHRYVQATICFREYSDSNLSSNSLISDFINIVDIYRNSWNFQSLFD